MQYLMLIGVILLAAAASFILGWIWYMPKVFGARWMRELGMTPEMMEEGKKKMPTKVVLGIVGDIVKALCFLFLIVAFAANQFFLAIIIWLGFMLPLLLTGVLYERKSWMLFWINSGYQLASLLIMGFVFYIV